MDFDIRTGFGYDIHRLVKKAGNLILATVKIPSLKTVDSHSDGDVLLHSLSNALYASVGKNDIGYYFPDNIEETKDMDSARILEHALRAVAESGYRISNVTVDIHLEKPKLADYRESIRESLVRLLKMDSGRIAVHFNTGEHLSDVGKGRAIIVYSQVCIVKDGQ